MKQITKFLFAWILSCTLSVAGMQGLPVFAEENTDIPETVLSEPLNTEGSQNDEPESGQNSENETEKESQDPENSSANTELNPVPASPQESLNETDPEANPQSLQENEEVNAPSGSSESGELSEGSDQNQQTLSGVDNTVNDPEEKTDQTNEEKTEETEEEENTEKQRTGAKKRSAETLTETKAASASSSSSLFNESAVCYEDVSDTADSLSGNLAFVIHEEAGDYTFGVRRSSVSASEAAFDETGKLSVTSQNYILASGEEKVILSVPSFRSSVYLYISEGALAATESSEEASGGSWNYQNHHLFYVSEAGTWYISGTADGSVTVTDNESEACEVSLYSGEEAPSRPSPSPRPGIDTKAPEVAVQPEIHPYVIEGSWYEAPSYSIEIKRPDGVEAASVSLQWNVNNAPYGEAQELAFDEEGKVFSSVYIEALLNQPYGVYPVSCTASITDAEGTAHSVTSYTSNFIVTRGVLADSVLTFSDVHNSFSNIGQAILDTMNSHNGLIPSLIIATGDFHTSQYAGYVEENINKATNTLVQPVKMQIAGIDTVWVAGNHDNGYAASYANQAAGLGVSSLYMNPEQGMSGTGIIFDSRSADYRANAGTSRSMNQGMIVIGINYEDLGSQGAYSAEGGRATDESKLTYGEEGSEHTVYAYLKQALQDISKNYHGEPVIISAHAGLHVLGVDPSSASAGGKEWGGTGSYNLNLSNAAVHLINYYASQYEMDIMFLFGHDHSRPEQEFLKLPGDTIVSTVSFDAKTTEEIQLNFTYGHSGYITGTIGGNQRYSLILTDDTEIHRQLKTVADANTLIDGVSTSIERHIPSIEPEPEPMPIPVPDPEPAPQPIPGSDTDTDSDSDPIPHPIPYPMPGFTPSVSPYYNPIPSWQSLTRAASDDDDDETPAVTSSGYIPVTCQMAGYTIDYAWNEAAKACQPGYIDDNGVFHAYSADRGRYYIPNTADR